MKKSLLLTLVTLPFLAGCYYPSQNPSIGQTSPFNTTTMLVGAGGAAAGGFAGNAINKTWGAPVGAAVGGLGAAGLTAMIQNNAQRDKMEAYEEGKREGRVEVFDQWWDDVAVFSDPLDIANKKGPKTRQIDLPSGSYESVPYLDRTYPYMVSPKP